MFLSVSNEVNDQVFGPIEVSGDMTLPDLVALLELDCQFDDVKHDLYYNMNKLDLLAGSTLNEIFDSDNDLLQIRNKIGVSVAEGSDDAFVEHFRQEMLRNQALRSQLMMQIPGLKQSLNDRQLFRERFGPLILQRKSSMNVHGNSQNPFGISQLEYSRIMSDPDDPSNQKRINELINRQEIEEQFQNAWEYTPEVFTTIHMLYISIEINGHPVKAFVDTGAQMTIISTRLAEETGLTRLIDKRFIGEARGVGTSKILGRIHQAQIKIETQYIPCTLTVLDTHVDILFGLDMLRRHGAIIDLKKDVLKIAGVETKFLGEAEIPRELMEDLEGSSSEKSKIVTGKPLPSFGQRFSGSAEQSPSDSTKRREVTKSSVLPEKPVAYSEQTIKQLMDLGFSRSEVIKALDQTNGNVDFAASILFQ
ncbi:hypothetical protein HG535_0B01360 [Zygotorulaspora mrakii]|uniref:DNA damage-inducible protein 1 n=1 Tax=Zygotorulaspora mrakii TaxID=42260 RepID=A0A7H9AXF7_ZYGMR|nr:uncharacterized protein HG535_0B01360 [Zygotorulaspora mrakii]QLG71098.1 hypothetical protein HG535_0B01360 [Zygotorulaspora mrakii]